MAAREDTDPARITFRPTAEDPERYDAFYAETRLGHLSLSEGSFVVTALDGEIVYRSRAGGWTVFWNTERDEHLEGARAALARWLQARSIT